MAEERFSLESLVSAVVVVALTALAYSLGWLKTFFYFQVFGVSLSSLEMPVQDYLFESWYVIENLLFLLLMWWIALRAKCGITGKVALWILAILYSSVPLAAHYSYAGTSGPAVWLTRHAHTVLKFSPFILIVVLLIVGLFEKRRGKDGLLNMTQGGALSWPYSQFSLAIAVVLFVALAISMAKHLGEADANRALKDPATWLARVTIYLSADQPGLPAIREEDELYLLHASPGHFVFLDYTALRRGGTKPPVRVIILPRDKVARIDTSYPLQVHPGSLY